MVSYRLYTKSLLGIIKVLILIVVDNGLVQQLSIVLSCLMLVLILIVVDNGLVHAKGEFAAFVTPVLILIVVDNGLVLDLIRHY